MSADGPGLLGAEALSVEYTTGGVRVVAVDRVTFTLKPGERLGIVGESGSGKSTVARAVLGTLPPAAQVTSGVLQVGGRSIEATARGGVSRDARGAEIGFVPQNPFGALNPILTLEKQFRNALRAHRRRATRAEARELAVRAMAGVGLAKPAMLLRARPHELSGGMKQRVVVALATWLSPSLVIADEPTTGLDLINQRLIMDLLRKGASDEGRSLLLVTHDLPMAAEYCARLLVMRAGRVVEEGSVNSILSNPKHEYTRQLIHSVAMLESGRLEDGTESSMDGAAR